MVERGIVGPSRQRPPTKQRKIPSRAATVMMRAERNGRQRGVIDFSPERYARRWEDMSASRLRYESLNTLVPRHSSEKLGGAAALSKLLLAGHPSRF